MKDIGSGERFLQAFHAGERWAIEEAFRTQAGRIVWAARREVEPVDSETVAHDLFELLRTSDDLRQSFKGGNFAAWITNVAVPSAIETLRARRGALEPDEITSAIDDEMEGKLLAARFRSEACAKEDDWAFEARFIHHTTQARVAMLQKMTPAAVIAQEQRLREELERFALGDSPCGTGTLVDAHFAGTIAPPDERRLRAHLDGCESCRDRYRKRQILGQMDPRALIPEERLGRALGMARSQRRASPIPLIAFVLAVLALVAFAVADR